MFAFSGIYSILESTTPLYNYKYVQYIHVYYTKNVTEIQDAGIPNTLGTTDLVRLLNI